MMKKNVKIRLCEAQVSKLVESSDISNHLIFKDENYGYHSNQSNNILYAYLGDNSVGYLDYSVYEGYPYINMIKVQKEYRGKNIGEELIKQLAKQYGYENIHWGGVTKAGLRLQNKMDKIFGFDRNYSVSKHLNVDILEKFKDISNDVYNFVKDYYYSGNKVWSNMDKYNQKNYEIDGIDPNDLADIVRWIEGAKENKNNPDEDVPYPVLDDLKSLGIVIQDQQNNKR